MEVITIESEAFKIITQQLEDLTSFVTKLSNEKYLVDEWRDEDKTCDQLGVSKRTMKRKRDNGEISFSKIGSKIYYRTSDVEEYLINHYVKAAKSGRRGDK